MRPHGYTPAAVIGEGTFSLVIRARRADGSEAALKVLRQEWLDDPRAAWRLRAEAEALRRTASPHVLPVLEFLDGDRPVIVTPLAAQGNLSSFIMRAPWPPDDVLHVADQLARGLETLHTMGETHGDVHPGNLLLHGSVAAARPLGPGARLWLADPWVQTVGGPDRPGWRERGTALFAAPERRTADPTVRSDLYGATLTVLLLALGPQGAGDHHEIPPWWRDVVRFGLAVDPVQRPADARSWLALVLDAISRQKGTFRCAPT